MIAQKIGVESSKVVVVPHGEGQLHLKVRRVLKTELFAQGIVPPLVSARREEGEDDAAFGKRVNAELAEILAANPLALAASARTPDAKVCVGIIAASLDGVKWEKIQVVMDLERENRAINRLWIGSLPTAALAAVKAAIESFEGAGPTAPNFRPGNAPELGHDREEVRDGSGDDLGVAGVEDPARP